MSTKKKKNSKNIFDEVSNASGSLSNYINAGSNATQSTRKQTPAQILNNNCFRYLANMYSKLRECLKGAYEDSKTSKVNFYTHYLRHNRRQIKVWFTKTEAEFGACIVAPLLISDGVLTEFLVYDAGDILKTNIRVPVGFAITEETTLGEVSQALLKSNPKLKEEDQLSIVHLVQTMSSDGIPGVEARLHEFTLLQKSNKVFYSGIPESMFQVLPDRYIGTDVNGEEGGVCYLLSRMISGKLHVSRQRIVLSPGNKLYERYSSEAQRKLALASYQQDERPWFLEPNVEHDQDEEAEYFSISSVKKNGTAVTRGSGVLAVSSGSTVEIAGTCLTTAALSVYLLDDPTGDPRTVPLSTLGTVTTTDQLITIQVTMEDAELYHLKRLDTNTVVFSFST